MLAYITSALNNPAAFVNFVGRTTSYISMWTHRSFGAISDNYHLIYNNLLPSEARPYLYTKDLLKIHGEETTVCMIGPCGLLELEDRFRDCSITLQDEQFEFRCGMGTLQEADKTRRSQRLLLQFSVRRAQPCCVIHSSYYTIHAHCSVMLQW